MVTKRRRDTSSACKSSSSPRALTDLKFGTKSGRTVRGRGTAGLATGESVSRCMALRAATPADKRNNLSTAVRSQR